MTTSAEDVFRILDFGPQFAYVASLPERRKEILKEYTQVLYRSLNEALRAGREPPYLSYAKGIDNIFDKVPPLENPVTVYRGVVGEWNPTLDSYVSTGVSPYIPFPNMGGYRIENDPITGEQTRFYEKGYYLKILIPAGAKVLPLALVSEHALEGEILLPRNYGNIKSQFVLTKTQRELIFDSMVTVLDVIYIPTVAHVPFVELAKKPLSDEVFEERFRSIYWLNGNMFVRTFRTPEAILDTFMARIFPAYSISEKAYADTIAFLQQDIKYRWEEEEDLEKYK